MDGHELTGADAVQYLDPQAGEGLVHGRYGLADPGPVTALPRLDGVVAELGMDERVDQLEPSVRLHLLDEQAHAFYVGLLDDIVAGIMPLHESLLRTRQS